MSVYSRTHSVENLGEGGGRSNISEGGWEAKPLRELFIHLLGFFHPSIPGLELGCLMSLEENYHWGAKFYSDSEL